MQNSVIAVAAALAAGVLVWLFLRARFAAENARHAATAEENTRLAAANSTQQAELLRLTGRNAELAAQLEHARQHHERLAIEFRALSADALSAQRADFLAQAASVFGQLRQDAAGDLDQKTQAVRSMVQPIHDTLARVDSKIAELERARAGAYGALSEQLQALQTAQGRLQAEAARLSTALRSTTYAGSWGELQLRRVVEMADMLPYCDFTEQETGGTLRADLVLRLPGGQRIVVDAKAPIDAFRAASESDAPEVRQARLDEHARKVKGHIDALGAKNYWEQFQPSPEFVVLFLPGDHFLTAALQTDPSLLDRALSRRVLLATPTTLIALLKAAAYGWNQEALGRNAEEISALGRTLYDRIATFAENLDRVGRGLEAANKGYNAAVGSFESMLLPGARRFAELGAKGAKELKVLNHIQSQVRIAESQQ